MIELLQIKASISLSNWSKVWSQNHLIVLSGWWQCFIFTFRGCKAAYVIDPAFCHKWEFIGHGISAAPVSCMLVTGNQSTSGLVNWVSRRELCFSNTVSVSSCHSVAGGWHDYSACENPSHPPPFFVGSGGWHGSSFVVGCSLGVCLALAGWFMLRGAHAQGVKCYLLCRMETLAPGASNSIGS